MPRPAPPSAILNFARALTGPAHHLRPTLSPILPIIPVHHQARALSVTSTMAEKLNFIDAVVHRRSVYPLTKTSPIPDSRILDLVSITAKHLPSSFDSQTSRLVVLLGAEHDKFWDFVWDAIKPHVAGTDKEAGSKGRIDGFKGGKGSVRFSPRFYPFSPSSSSSSIPLTSPPFLPQLTDMPDHQQILFFESATAVKKVADQYQAYADKFPQWSEHTSAMHQFVLWTALEAEGLGANLQHYNPIVDDRVKKEYGLDDDWQLKAQLVFGGLPEGKKREELLLPKDVEGRDKKWVKVFGA
ncbi:hypothetical protein CAC42_1395 [Sphaceloma murrayae]|uniref:Nitroreductase domain-containing protein n=1 Tax=Sphaceloma murrayae TaxID=2082308 RepID=A0A2K1QFK8_9PEZI|nr:hypothetical protein CAC42_1395 [Sphaceloma murrayae]